MIQKNIALQTTKQRNTTTQHDRNEGNGQIINQPCFHEPLNGDATVVLGSGIPLFGKLHSDVQLNHVATRSYEFGFVQLQYKVSKAKKT